MDKDRIMKLRALFQEIKVNFLDTTTTPPVSPKWGFWGGMVAQNILMLRLIK